MLFVCKIHKPSNSNIIIVKLVFDFLCLVWFYLIIKINGLSYLIKFIIIFIIMFYIGILDFNYRKFIFNPNVIN